MPQRYQILTALCPDKMLSSGAAVRSFIFCMMVITSAQTNAQSCANMIAKVNELKAEIEGMCPQTTATTPLYSPYKWTSVPYTVIGTTNLRNAGTLSFTIPSVIPSSAREVLIHAVVLSGFSDNGPYHSIKFFTQIGTSRYEKYLYLESWGQEAINTNSDNMWFPMPPNRRVHLTVPAAHGRNAGSKLFAIGYR